MRARPNYAFETGGDIYVTLAPVSELRPRRVGPYEARLKPVADRLVALAALVALSPVIAATAAVVRVTCGSPVLFLQQRVGRDGQPFTVYKFRTMTPDRRAARIEVAADRERRRTHKSPFDPRHTPVGRFLRQTSLDELPQLWNVVIGDMSLVGPRPELVEVVARYKHWQHARHSVKPGVTGAWQISQRGSVPMHEATQVDLDYIRRLSLREDLRILFATPKTLLLRRGA